MARCGGENASWIVDRRPPRRTPYSSIPQRFDKAFRFSEWPALKLPERRVLRSGYNNGGVDVDGGGGLGSAGAGETAGDGVAEAAASLLLASSSNFFSSM
jgi:hypothetical protein